MTALPSTEEPQQRQREGRALRDEARLRGADPRGARCAMTRRLLVDASAVVDLLGRFRPEPIKAFFSPPMRWWQRPP